MPSLPRNEDLLAAYEMGKKNYNPKVYLKKRRKRPGSQNMSISLTEQPCVCVYMYIFNKQNSKVFVRHIINLN